MKLTLLSLAIAAIMGFLIWRGYFKGKKKGFINSAIELLILLLSVVLSAILSVWAISGPVASLLTSLDFIQSLINNELSEMPGAYSMIEALVAAIISPVIFLTVIGIVNLLFTLVARLIMRRVSGKEYDAENAPWYVRNSEKIGSYVGCFTGLLLSVIMCAPIIGTVKVGAEVMTKLGEANLIPVSVVKRQRYDVLMDCADDVMANVVYTVGGEVIYDSVARSTLHDRGFVLSEEVTVVFGLFDEVQVLTPKLAEMASLTKKDIAELQALCDEIDKSVLATNILSEVVSGASRQWITGESYFGKSAPVLGDVVDALFQSVLKVFAVTNPKYVVNDFRTFLNVYSIILESGFIAYGNDYAAIVEALENNPILDNINAELAKNPRMAAIADDMYDMAVRSAIKVIQLPGYDYQALLEDIAYQFNDLAGMPSDKKIEVLTGYAEQYLGDYGYDGISSDIVGMLAGSLVTDMENRNQEEIDYDILNDYFNEYLNGTN